MRLASVRIRQEGHALRSAPHGPCGKLWLPRSRDAWRSQPYRNPTGTGCRPMACAVAADRRQQTERAFSFRRPPHHPRVVAAGTEGRSERHLAVPRVQAIWFGIGDGSPAYGPGLITGLRRAGILLHRMPEMYRRPVAALTDDVGVNIAILRGSLRCLVRWAGRRGPWSMRVRVKMVARGGWRAWDRL